MFPVVMHPPSERLSSTILGDLLVLVRLQSGESLIPMEVYPDWFRLRRLRYLDSELSFKIFNYDCRVA